MRKIIEGNIVDVINKCVNKGKIYIEDSKISDIQFEDVESDNWILPGFVDAHVHIESSMVVPSEFARAAVRFGTVAVVSDPHEIANVLGVKGVEYMLQNASNVPFKFYFGAPSCVPATVFETSGAKISVDEIKYLFDNYDLKFLSEMMNYPGVINEIPEVIEKIKIANKYNKKIDGHAPGLRGDDLKKYISFGIETDHECFSLSEAREKADNGMKILIREGSAAKNFEELSQLIKEKPDMCMFCSDDLHPDDLTKGHINLLVKRSLKKGFDLFDVLKVASLNPIEHYGLDVGLLRKGDFADFIVIDSLDNFEILQTYINGNLVAEKGNSNINLIEVKKINNFNAEKITVDEIKVQAKSDEILVIKAIEGELITDKIITKAKIENDYVISDIDSDILKIVVYNRYNKTKPAIGFVNNFGLKKGAIGTSVAHDSHNIIAVGANDDDLVAAINAIIDVQGGMCIALNEETDILPLPIAGIMSAKSVEETAQKYQTLNEKAKSLGTSLNAPFMTLSFMGLLVIPKLKLSDKGLFDVEKFSFTNIFL